MIFLAFTSIVWKSQDGRYEICAISTGRHQVLVNGHGRVLQRRIVDTLTEAIRWCNRREEFITRAAA